MNLSNRNTESLRSDRSSKTGNANRRLYFRTGRHTLRQRSQLFVLHPFTLLRRHDRRSSDNWRTEQPLRLTDFHRLLTLVSSRGIPEQNNRALITKQRPESKGRVLTCARSARTSPSITALNQRLRACLLSPAVRRSPRIDIRHKTSVTNHAGIRLENYPAEFHSTRQNNCNQKTSQITIFLSKKIK